MENYFDRLNRINVSEHIEKKGDFSYLSWPFAVAQLRLADPSATWEVRRFDGMPYLRTETGYFVEVAVTVQGVTLSQIHPVLDGKNRPVAEPTSFDINTSIQRCLVKAIALHGLGLYVYAGEDLPDSESSSPKVTSLPTKRTVTVGQQRYLARLPEEAGWTEQRLLDYFGIASIPELPMSEFDRALKAFDLLRINVENHNPLVPSSSLGLATNFLARAAVAPRISRSAQSDSTRYFLVVYTMRRVPVQLTRRIAGVDCAHSHAVNPADPSIRNPS